MLTAFDNDGRRLTAEEQRAIDILDEQDRAAGGRRKRRPKPDLDEGRIVEWAAEHHARTGKWPTNHAGMVQAAEPPETWCGIGLALSKGLRGLSGGTTLSRLLAERTGRYHPHSTPDLNEEQIVAWAVAHRERTGRWPGALSGAIAESAPGDTWGAVSRALVNGGRGLPGGTTLARLFEERAGKRPHRGQPRLTEEQILVWADAHRARAGQWPAGRRVQVPEAGPGETWSKIDNALYHGQRGLPGGSSLARLLAERRGANRPGDRRRNLTAEEILAWARAHRDRTGRWPSARSGVVSESGAGETWAAVDNALRTGARGLPGGSSLPALLEQDPGGGRRLPDRSPLDEERILVWADAYHAATGRWPRQKSGPVEGGGGRTWALVDKALRLGRHGLPGGSSLALLLQRERGMRNPGDLPSLTAAEILSWADAHRARTGQWPTSRSGGIPESPCGDTWAAVDSALVRGARGLTRPGADAPDSLPRLLQRERGVVNAKGRPRLTEAQILAWADEHHARTGSWPWLKSGRIVDAPDETWMAVEAALTLVTRGLPGGSSLAQLLRRERGESNRPKPPPLSEEMVLRWADAHRQRTGHWPTQKSGVVVDAVDAPSGGGGETWAAIESALQKGTRGLPGGSSLARLLQTMRGASYRNDRPTLAGGGARIPTEEPTEAR